MSCSSSHRPFWPAIPASAASCDRGGAQQAGLAIPREILMLKEKEELCYPPIAEAKAVPTRMVMLRFAPARQPLNRCGQE